MYKKLNALCLIASSFILTSCGGGKTKTCSIAEAFPMDYKVTTDGLGEPQALHIYGASETYGAKLYLFPWAPHAEPHTGHPGEDIKANMMGHFIYSPTQPEITELAGGNGNDICEPGETCGVHKGIIRSRLPYYRAPKDNFKITRVALSRIQTGPIDGGGNSYLDTGHHWDIEGEVCQYHYRFGHVGWVGEDLKNALLHQGLPNPDTYSAPLGVNLLNKPITLNKGQTVAIPQILVREIPGHPNFVETNARAQIEFPTRNLKSGHSEPIYKWLSAEVQTLFRKIMHKEMQDLTSSYYASAFDWLYLAESDLYTVSFANRSKYSGLTDNAQAWFEKSYSGPSCSAAPGSANRELCNDTFNVWPISKASALYNPSLYESGVTFLAFKSQLKNPVDVDYFFRGEVLSPIDNFEKSGTALIKWRLQSSWIPLALPIYQKLTYHLNSSSHILKIHWGVEDTNRSTIESTPDPVDPKDLPCDGVNIVCYNHDFPQDGQYRPGF